LADEFNLIQEDQVLFTYLHLAPDRTLTEALIERKCIGVAYETIQLDDGSLPLLTPMSEVAGRLAPQVGAFFLEKAQGGKLTPMSEVAGRLAPQVGAFFLEKAQGGKGVLLGGVPGVERGRVTIIGGGVVGTSAARIAVGLGANVYILDVNTRRLAYLDEIFRNTISTVMSTPANVSALAAQSDLVIGAVLVPGALSPCVVTAEMVASMSNGSVIVDVAIDQGGCFETSKPTTHQDPIYIVDGVVHYCVANIPGSVPRTSTFALTNVTLPYVLEIANKGLKNAIKEDAALAKGVNIHKGVITHPAVAQAMNCAYEDVLFASGDRAA